MYIPDIDLPVDEVTISNFSLSSKAATTLSVTWSAGYPKCYSFTVSHSTQDGSITVTQPADSDTSHTLTSLQPGTTYRIEVEAVRKGEGADGQRAKVMGNFTTAEGITSEEYMLSCSWISLIMHVRLYNALFSHHVYRTSALANTNCKYPSIWT